MSKLNITELKKDFKWFENNKEYIYIDNSATSLKPRQVLEKMNEYYEVWGTNTHNNDSKIAYHVNFIVDDTRNKLAKFFNVTKDEIAFTSGATESLNLVAEGIKHLLKEDDEIILSLTEHSSNMLPWQKIAQEKKLKLVFVGAKNKLPTEQDFIDAITPKTRIVTFCNVSNLFAYNLDVEKISKLARKKHDNLMIVVDATQAAPHMKIDLQKWNVDFMVCSGHKMLAPTGIGCLYFNKKWFKELEPIKLGGGMNSDVTCNSYTYASTVEKFEGGTPNIGAIFGWNAAIDYLNNIGMENIHDHELALKKYLNEGLKNIPNLDFRNPESEFPILMLNMKGVHAQDLATYLSNKKIIVRSGVSCVKLAKMVTENDPAVVRASFYFYNTFEDADYLIKVLKEYKKGDELNYVFERSGNNA